MIKDQYADALARAAENVQEHTVTEVCAKRNENGDFLAGIYRCMKPNGSSNYGFDISISRFGISVYGDIGELVFNVGTSYGTEFLARKSVDGYMISKLCEFYRQDKVLDEDKLKVILIEAAAELIDVRAEWPLEDEDLPGEPPEWIWELANGQLENPLERADELMELMGKLKYHVEHGAFEEFIDAYEVLVNEKLPEGLKAVDIFLGDNYDALYLGFGWYEHNYSKHCESLIERLEMVRLMAIKIEEMECNRLKA